MKKLHSSFVSSAMRSPLVAAALSAALYGPGLAVHAADLAPVNAKPVPLAAVDALNKLSGGPHAGYRANHAKGVLVMGSFTPAESAASLSKAPHFAVGQSVPVIVRFSTGTGVPTLPDVGVGTLRQIEADRYAVRAAIRIGVGQRGHTCTVREASNDRNSLSHGEMRCFAQRSGAFSGCETAHHQHALGVIGSITCMRTP